MFHKLAPPHYPETLIFTGRPSPPPPPLYFLFFCTPPQTQERRDAALRGKFTVKRRPQAAEGAHPLAQASRKSGGMFDRKPAIVLDPLAVRPLLNTASYKPSRKPVGVFGKERR